MLVDPGVYFFFMVFVELPGYNCKSYFREKHHLWMFYCFFLEGGENFPDLAFVDGPNDYLFSDC